MTQPNSPYQPPSPLSYHAPPADPGRPARYAGLLMLLLGGLILLMGGCLMVGGAIVERSGQMPPEAAQAFAPLLDRGYSLQVIFVAMGGCVALPGLGLIVTGLFVRTGRAAAIVVGIILTALMLFYFLAQALLMLVRVGGGDTQAALSLCMSGLILSVLGLQGYWLIQAMQNSKQLAAAKLAQQQWADYQRQMYQQQQPPGGQ